MWQEEIIKMMKKKGSVNSRMVEEAFDLPQQNVSQLFQSLEKRPDIEKYFVQEERRGRPFMIGYLRFRK